ncbi:hypothetical protein KCP70_21375 [Salmonella enterica subsp. enterica]|nr:hypothetical protein KCP70_21375 [Salmonella enterica subsp. enterica]
MSKPSWISIRSMVLRLILSARSGDARLSGSDAMGGQLVGFYPAGCAKAKAALWAGEVKFTGQFCRQP